MTLIIIIKEFGLYESRGHLYNLKDGTGKRCYLFDLGTLLAVKVALWAPKMNLVGKIFLEGGKQCPWAYSPSCVPHEMTPIVQSSPGPL